MNNAMTKRDMLKARDAKIVANRVRHGGSATHCPTCTRPAFHPYRRIVDGKIVEGCVDACHSAHVSPASHSGASYEWHWRPEAIALRA